MNIRELRENWNFSQDFISKVTGIPRDRIAKWEQGKGAPKVHDQNILNLLENRLRDIVDNEIGREHWNEIFQSLAMGFLYKKALDTKGLTDEDLRRKFKLPPVALQEMEKGYFDITDPTLAPIWEFLGIKLPEGINIKATPNDKTLSIATIPNAKTLGEEKGIYKNANNEFIELAGGKYLMKTKLVSQKARAGYMAGWGDEHYLEDLPEHAIVVDKPHLGFYISFEAEGDSMDDGTSRSIQSGDILTGRRIERPYWKSKLHLTSFRDYILVTTSGIIVKEILKHDVENGILTCHSLNPDKEQYPDFELSFENVMQLFNIVQVARKR